MAAVRTLLETYSKVIRTLVLGLAVVATLAVLAMMGVTCVDVIMRLFGTALTGSRDLVCVAGAVAAGCALPYTTAVKGHVAVEFFFHKLGGIGRVVVDTLMRLCGMALFIALAWCCFRHARAMHMPRHLITGPGPILRIWPVFLLTCAYFVALAAVVQRVSEKGWRQWSPGRVGRVLAAVVVIHALVVWGWLHFLAKARAAGLFSARVNIEVYSNLPIPKAGVVYLLAFCCAVVVLVILQNLLHPGREMIKP
jgi:TRAP-type C4-dicarboxylate transport system permease small subunit